MDKKMVCACGLACCDCLFHTSELYETAEKLKGLIEKSQFDVFIKLMSGNKDRTGIKKFLSLDDQQVSAYSELFDKLPQLLVGLDAVIKLQCKTTCRESGGCAVGGVTHECVVLKCLRVRKFQGCWECGDTGNCDKLAFLKKNYGETIEGNLKIIKNEGFEVLKPRGNKYYSWQRK
jgi:hypothetical protein